MRNIRGLPGKRQLWALCLGAAILPAALAGSGELAAWTACLYWLTTVATVIFGSVVLARLLHKDHSMDDDPRNAL